MLKRRRLHVRSAASPTRSTRGRRNAGDSSSAERRTGATWNCPQDGFGGSLGRARGQVVDAGEISDHVVAVALRRRRSSRLRQRRSRRPPDFDGTLEYRRPPITSMRFSRTRGSRRTAQTSPHQATAHQPNTSAPPAAQRQPTQIARPQPHVPQQRPDRAVLPRRLEAQVPLWLRTQDATAHGLGPWR